MLNRFREAKQAEIERLVKLEDEGLMPPPFEGERPDFIRALWENGPGAVIAEYKRASPSRGEINMGLTPEQAADAYRKAGAAAMSVLTEEVYFKGSLEYLSRMAGAGLPLLRKDFILHPVQVIHTASTPASALLLIARMCEAEELRAMLGLAEAFGLACVVEVFDEADLNKVEPLEPEIIQVNNRDLDKLTTDFAVSERLAARKQEGQIWISASGIKTRQDVERMAALGYDAVLVGTSLMSGEDPGAALAGLTGRR
ncbi:indole-3-glycerol-phosphate synthase [Fundidesulfovibrio agrisoli]|uniref:indole-3-glycerol-phosphate synthase n=1 Tax=Fundidesulfovibrio agrisoli TaxID=2922717 RepID=UPI001FAC592E|nr:indole-3-glycerol-phosphate synthase [Fundidesulfovibrio agrisoli]